jgi:hypothetical protein
LQSIAKREECAGCSEYRQCEDVHNLIHSDGVQKCLSTSNFRVDGENEAAGAAAAAAWGSE